MSKFIKEIKWELVARKELLNKKRSQGIPIMYISSISFKVQTLEEIQNNYPISNFRIPID
jgi:hypothetical protein